MSPIKHKEGNMKMQSSISKEAKATKSRGAAETRKSGIRPIICHLIRINGQK
jgi:hypothetical protein